MPNPVASSSSPKFLQVPSSSRPVPISVPFTIQYPWFHQTHVDRGDREFATNASAAWVSQHPVIVVVDSDGHATSSRGEDSGSVSSTSSEGEEHRYRKGPGLDGATSVAPGAIRSRPIRSQRVHQRAFHNGHWQPYIYLPLQVSPISKPHKLPLELPLPTSPTRPRRYRSLRRTWLDALYSGVNVSRLRSLPSFYLALYFTLNLGLTLYNKSVLIHFPFPYTLSAIHALCGSIGTFVLVRSRNAPPPKLNVRETCILLAFSFLYTINIIVSNVSLGLVTVPVSQFTLFLSYH